MAVLQCQANYAQRPWMTTPDHEEQTAPPGRSRLKSSCCWLCSCKSSALLTICSSRERHGRASMHMQRLVRLWIRCQWLRVTSKALLVVFSTCHCSFLRSAAQHSINHAALSCFAAVRLQCMVQQYAPTMSPAASSVMLG